MAADQQNPIIRWPWMVGGSHDGQIIDPEILRRNQPFNVLKYPPVPTPDLVAEENSIIEETYVPRKFGSSSSPLRVSFFAYSESKESMAAALLWERLVERAMAKSLAEEIMESDPDSLVTGLQESVVELRRTRPRTHAEGEAALAHADLLRGTARVIEMIPKCPRCKTRLICREPTRRFTEDDNYVQCEQGHVFGLTDITDGGEYKDVQHRIAGLFLEGKLYAGAPTEHGIEFQKIE